MRSPITAELNWRKRVNEKAGQDAGKQAQHRQEEHGGEREPKGIHCGLGGARPRTAEKCHAIGLDEASRRERRRKRQQCSHGRHEKLKSP